MRRKKKHMKRNRIMEFSEYKSVKRWTFPLSQKTCKDYICSLIRFCEWCGVDPDQLVIERHKNLESKDIAVKRRIEDLVVDYFTEYSKTRSYTTARHVLCIKTFCVLNRLRPNESGAPLRHFECLMGHTPRWNQWRPHTLQRSNLERPTKKPYDIYQ